VSEGKMHQEDVQLLDFNDSKVDEEKTMTALKGEVNCLPHESLKEAHYEPYIPSTTATEIHETTMIIVGLRIINFGSDLKFEDDPFNVKLHHIMDPFDYSSSIQKINNALDQCRANAVDHALLAVGPTILPLIPWAVRQKLRKNSRRKILTQSVETFNKEHPQLFMRWQTRPEKQLTIMTKSAAVKLMTK
jgi:hypothetical protein